MWHDMAWQKTKTKGRKVKLGGIRRARGKRECTVGGTVRPWARIGDTGGLSR